MANKIKIVKCRYPKCSKLHESTDLPKDKAVAAGGSRYYHPDCYHIMQTVNKIRDLFIKNIDSTLTGKQIGTLVSTINNIIFDKKVDVEYLKFALEYFIKNKPGKLNYAPGLHYIIKDKDVINSWKKYNEQKIRQEFKELRNDDNEEITELDLSNSFVYKPQSSKSFADILH